MTHVLLTYTLAPDYLARRPQFRADHLAMAQAAVALRAAPVLCPNPVRTELVEVLFFSSSVHACGPK